MSPQEFEQIFSYLLPWHMAEKRLGRKLDYNNNMDCCLYHDMLVAEVRKAMDEKEKEKAR